MHFLHFLQFIQCVGVGICPNFAGFCDCLELLSEPHSCTSLLVSFRLTVSQHWVLRVNQGLVVSKCESALPCGTSTLPELLKRNSSICVFKVQSFRPQGGRLKVCTPKRMASFQPRRPSLLTPPREKMTNITELPSPPQQELHCPVNRSPTDMI